MGAVYQPDEGLLGERLEETIKVLTVVFLVAFSLFLISLYRAELEEYVFYMHFLYLPIVLATFWWGKQGIAVGAFLGIAVIIITVLTGSTQEEIFSSLIEATLFVIVAALVGMLSDEKQQALEQELCFKRDTAHYFFNPLCIAEGNLELARLKAPDDLKKEISETEHAVARIKKVVVNVVERGEIHE
jgi:glucose-6-phosphate-specific signal transduction histidine kinase